MKRKILTIGSRVGCLLLLSACCLAPNPSSAALQWDATSKNIRVHPLQASAKIVFCFCNAGSDPVTILELKPTCGCLTGEAGKKKTYEPGETGSVELHFNLEKREGPQRKGITVKTSDGKSTMLYVSTNIEPSFRFSSKRLIWTAGEKRMSKSLQIINQNKLPFPLKEATPSCDGVSVDLITKRKGFEYELRVTPDAGLKNVLVPIVIRPEKPKELDAVRTYTVYALVK